MNNELEKYIQANREAFDDEQPSPGVWSAVAKQFGSAEKAGNTLAAFIQNNLDEFNDEQPGDKVWNAIEKQFVEKQKPINRLEEFIHDNRVAFDDERPPEQVWQAIAKQFDGKEKAGNTLEAFVKTNRPAFDDEQPSPQVWNNIAKQFGDKQPEKVFTIKRSVVRMVSAAAAVVIIAVAAWVITGNKNDVKVVAKNNPTVDTPPSQQLAQVTPPVIKPQSPVVEPQKDNISNSSDNSSNTEPAPEDEQKQEIYYYAKLTEIKFNQLKRIEKDEPVLYKSFAGEIKKLDSAYHGLQTMLGSGKADKEAVLTAMVTNLKMQAEILNKQLYIIQSLKKAKQHTNENNDKSI